MRSESPRGSRAFRWLPRTDRPVPSTTVTVATEVKVSVAKSKHSLPDESIVKMREPSLKRIEFSANR